MYKKCLSRITNKDNTKPKETPNTKLQKMAESPEFRKELVKKALFGEVLKEQLQENFSEMKTRTKKKNFTKIVSGKLVDKYKLWRIENSGVLTYKRVKNAKLSHGLRKNKLSDECAKSVVQFYENDSNSRLGAGKKEYMYNKKASAKTKTIHA